MMALKKCSKLHKVFLAELERCERMDREGAQVLSSLANVAKRVPLLADHTVSPGGAVSPGGLVSPLGVLDFIPDTAALLLEKHFLSMEKSASLLRDILRDFVDAVRRLRGFVDEFVELVDEVSLVVAAEEEEREEEEERISPMGPALAMLEWMENVRTMYERDALRKRLLVADVEYWDVARLQRMHREWPASASGSFVDVAYVRMGTEELPPLPVVSNTAKSETEEGSRAPSTSETGSTKTKKKKKKKQAKTG